MRTGEERSKEKSMGIKKRTQNKEKKEKENRK